MVVGYNRGLWESKGWVNGSSRGRTAKRTKPRFEPSNCDRDALLRGRLLEPPLLVLIRNEENSIEWK
jgi:hypothetical protein